MQCNAMQCNAIQYNTAQHSAHSTAQHTIQYNTIQYNTIQYNTIQYNTIQYNTIFNTPQRGFLGVNYRLHYKNGRKIRGVRSVMHLNASVLLLLIIPKGGHDNYNVCCGLILSLVQILFSFVLNSLSYITIPKIKLNHNMSTITNTSKLCYIILLLCFHPFHSCPILST